MSAPARRELVRWMTPRGVSERQALRIVRISRELAALSASAGSQRCAARADREAGASSSPLRRGNDLPEAPASRPGREPQASRPAVRAGEAAAQASAKEEDTDRGPPAAAPACGGERSVVDGLRVRSGRWRTGDQEPGDRRRCDPRSSRDRAGAPHQRSVSSYAYSS